MAEKNESKKGLGILGWRKMLNNIIGVMGVCFICLIHYYFNYFSGTGKESGEITQPSTWLGVIGIVAVTTIATGTNYFQYIVDKGKEKIPTVIDGKDA